MFRSMLHRSGTMTQRLLSVHPDLAGASLMCLLGASGIVVGVLLSLLKFMSDHNCGFSLVSACGIGGYFAGCEQVLRSGWATILGIPISIVATAHYAVLFGLAVFSLARPLRALEVARPLLLLIGWAGLLVVPPLALYASLSVRNLCSYCLVVYGLNVAIFLAAWWMHPEGHRAGIAVIFARRVRGRTTALLLVGLSFLALVLLQTQMYQRSAASVDIGDRCWREGELPATSLQTDAQNPEIEIALFLDLACPHCREELAFWSQHVRASTGRYRLSIYHFPPEGDCVPPDEELFSAVAHYQQSCQAARAVECADLRRPGAGLAMVSRLFELQEGNGPYFAREPVLRVAEELGVAGPDRDGETFAACFTENPAVLRTIQEHVKFARDRGLSATPGVAFAIHDQDGSTLPHIPFYVGTKVYPDDLGTYFTALRDEATAKKEQR